MNIFRGVLSVCSFLALFALLCVSAAGQSLTGYAEEDEAGRNYAEQRITGIPVLCYHTFYPEERRFTPGPLAESYQEFEKLLGELRDEGYQSLIPDPVDKPIAPKAKSVIFTFDDGHKSQLRAAELLESYDMRGLFFVIPELIDNPEFSHMTSSEIASLAERGHLIGSHGHRHKSLPVSGPEIIATLDTVPGILSGITGVKPAQIHSLAFPFGHFTPAVTNAMYSQYPFQYTVNPGYWDGESTLIPRIMITRDTDPGFYRDYLAGAFAQKRLLTMKEGNGSRQSKVHFRNHAGIDPESLYLQAISPDLDGNHYSTFSIDSYLIPERKGTEDNGEEVLAFDITSYLEDHHPKENRALSFAIAQKKKGYFQYVSDGYLIWVTRSADSSE